VLWVFVCQKYTSCTHQINELNTINTKKNKIWYCYRDNSHWSCVNFERRLLQGGVLHWLSVVIAWHELHVHSSWLLLRVWQSNNLKQFGCFCTQKRSKLAQIYPIIPHVHPWSRLKYPAQLTDVDRMKFEHQATYSSLIIVHCSLFYWNWTCLIIWINLSARAKQLHVLWKHYTHISPYSACAVGF